MSCIRDGAILLSCIISILAMLSAVLKFTPPNSYISRNLLATEESYHRILEAKKWVPDAIDNSGGDFSAPSRMKRRRPDGPNIGGERQGGRGSGGIGKKMNRGTRSGKERENMVITQSIENAPIEHVEVQQEEINTGGRPALRQILPIEITSVDLKSDASVNSYLGMFASLGDKTSFKYNMGKGMSVQLAGTFKKTIQPSSKLDTETTSISTSSTSTMVSTTTSNPIDGTSKHLIPDYLALAKAKGIVPDFTNQKAVFEKDEPKLHLCNAQFEAYSAAWLTTKAHVLEVKSEGFNLTWVNCEMASFIHMKDSKSFFSNAQGKGMIIQSLDVLDFSVIHLSTYERSNRKYMRELWKNAEERRTEWSKIGPVVETAKILEAKIKGKKIEYIPEAKRTIVVMPFLGGAMGAGHSELGNRFEYLKACFWSVYEVFPNIAIGVKTQADVDWGWKESGLPFYDIMLLENLPKPASLPVATTQRTKDNLLSGKWNFDYVYYTESDQILMIRILPLLYESLRQYPSRMLLPHRLMSYSNRAIQEVHKKTVSPVHEEWEGTMSCCLERQNCGDRKTWVKLRDSKVPVLNYYGLYIPLGNVNFLDEKYRSCKLGQYVDVCP